MLTGFLPCWACLPQALTCTCIDSGICFPAWSLRPKSCVASSVEWLWQHTDNGHKHASWQAAWAAWSCEAKVSPGKWKAKVRAAQQCAVLRERWRATTNRHQGLLYKQLCALGARTPVDLFEDLPPQECCAPCQRRFGPGRCTRSLCMGASRSRDVSRLELSVLPACSIILQHQAQPTHPL